MLVTLAGDEDVALSALSKGKDMFVCNSGASTHMTYQKGGMFDMKPCDKKVAIGNGKFMKAASMRKAVLLICKTQKE